MSGWFKQSEIWEELYLVCEILNVCDGNAET